MSCVRLMIVDMQLTVVTHVYHPANEHPCYPDGYHEITAWSQNNKLTAVTLKGEDPFDYYKRTIEEWVSE